MRVEEPGSGCWVRASRGEQSGQAGAGLSGEEISVTAPGDSSVGGDTEPLVF